MSENQNHVEGETICSWEIVPTLFQRILPYLLVTPIVLIIYMIAKYGIGHKLNDYGAFPFISIVLLLGFAIPRSSTRKYLITEKFLWEKAWYKDTRLLFWEDVDTYKIKKNEIRFMLKTKRFFFREKLDVPIPTNSFPIENAIKKMVAPAHPCEELKTRRV